MPITNSITLAISIVALLISIWGRVEAYQNLKAQRRSDLIKRTGEALLSAQILKNSLSDQLDAVKEFINHPEKELFIHRKHAETVGKKIEDLTEHEKALSVEMYLEDFNKSHAILQTNYDSISQFIKRYELIILEHAKQTEGASLITSTEAIIGHLNQTKALSEYNIATMKKLLKR